MVEVVEGLGAGEDAGGGAHLEVDLVAETPGVQRRVPQHRVAVPDPLRAQHVQRLLHALGRPHLARVHRAVDPELRGAREHRHRHRVEHVGLRGVEPLLVPRDVDAHDALVSVLDTQPQHVLAELVQAADAAEQRAGRHPGGRLALPEPVEDCLHDVVSCDRGRIPGLGFGGEEEVGTQPALDVEAAVVGGVLAELPRDPAHGGGVPGQGGRGVLEAGQELGEVAGLLHLHQGAQGGHRAVTRQLQT